ncbi:MAG TPA: nuclear transport factor 2 family protein [Tepidisphaeraceae bacterium]|jgi:ketosteroid isomerase-like protein
MKTEDVAKRLVELCNKQEFRKAIEELYSPDIVSLEAFTMPGSPMPREVRGLQAINGKTDWWEKNHTVHSFKTTGPFIAQDKFVTIFALEATDKQSGKRFKMNEAAVYTVANGKIVHEEFLMGDHGQM